MISANYSGFIVSHPTKVARSVVSTFVAGGKCLISENILSWLVSGDSDASEPIIYLEFGVESVTVDIELTLLLRGGLSLIPRATRIS